MKEIVRKIVKFEKHHPNCKKTIYLMYGLVYCFVNISEFTKRNIMKWRMSLITYVILALFIMPLSQKLMHQLCQH
ncbi:MAG: hypothetical protein ACLT6Z_12565 [Coprobacillus cateniformis]